MIIKNIFYEDFVNYKKPSMFIAMPYCNFKCDKENGSQLCQNWALVKDKNIDIGIDTIITKYLNNKISKAIVFGGLEPFDSFEEIITFIDVLRNAYKCNDDVVIYTGYNKEEITDELKRVKKYKNIVIKFGRFRPNQTPHLDEVLGIYLASDNQFAERVS